MKKVVYKRLVIQDPGQDHVVSCLVYYRDEVT